MGKQWLPAQLVGPQLGTVTVAVTAITIVASVVSAIIIMTTMITTIIITTITKFFIVITTINTTTIIITTTIPIIIPITSSPTSLLPSQDHNQLNTNKNLSCCPLWPPEMCLAQCTCIYWLHVGAN